MSQVVSIKLTSGEEIIAEITKEITDGIVIVNPLSIQPMRSPSGISLSFLPWILSARDDEEMTIFRSAVITITVPQPEVIASYRKHTSSIDLSVAPSALME